MRRLPATIVLGLAAAAASFLPTAGAGPRSYDIAPLLRPAQPPAATPAGETPPPEVTEEPVLAPFAAGRDSWYLAGSVGLALPRTADARGAIDIRVDLENGGALAGAAGYAWRNGFRVEGQVWHQAFGVNDVVIRKTGNIPGLDAGAPDPDGNASATFFTVNLAYDVETAGRWSPYAIGGVGAANIVYNDISRGNVRIIDDSAWEMAFQFGLGLSYLFSGNWSAEASYRYAFTLDPMLNDAANDTVETEFATHNFLFGARYGF